MKFTSHIISSIIIKLFRNGFLIFLLYLTSSIIDYKQLIPFEISILEIIILYLVTFLIQIYLTNYELIIEESEIIVQSSLIEGSNKKIFEKNEIKEIIFKDDWVEKWMSIGSRWNVGFILVNFVFSWILPLEYKWIQIKTNENKKHTYYFFGMEFDYHDNTDEILFEDMFIELAKNNIKVKWKSTKNIYFNGLQKEADQILFTLNK